ncbi:MAG: DUF167 domain-containing protein [Candidatus Pacebacteria bacterium]|nr:DUF167 domain-containing protein [Candidatus Paceibacterota bacterium]
MKVNIKVKTKAKQEKVVEMGNNNFEVHVKQLPEQGKANIAVIKILAKYFKIPQNNIKILAGKTNSRKIAEIDFAH